MTISTKPIQPGEIDRLYRHMNPPDNTDHRACADLQSRGEGTYLVAWDGEVPVAHLYIRWTGNTEVPRIAGRLPQAAQFAAYPEFCDVYVTPERRSKGIGTLLLEGAMLMACERGIAQVTLCVDTDNPRARSLYERLGFVEPGIGVFTTSGVYVNEAGQEVPWRNGPQFLLVLDLLSSARLCTIQA